MPAAVQTLLVDALSQRRFPLFLWKLPTHLRVGLDDGHDQLHRGDLHTMVALLQHVHDPLHEVLHVLRQVPQDADAAQGGLRNEDRGPQTRWGRHEGKKPSKWSTEGSAGTPR